jgi:predicted RNA binding protein YcfA (HicA-like mRNA interferase family)
VKIPRDDFGRDLADMPCRVWGYREVHQVGSHIILHTETPTHHRVSVPAHKPLRLGTFSAILREVAAAKRTTREAILDTL